MIEIDFKPIERLSAEQWQKLWRSDYPFVQYPFYQALEASQCTDHKRGWAPTHAIATNAGEPVAAMPLYLKAHSYGEYVFDWAWANAYEQAGFEYYPKLLCAAPFTPSTGARIATINGDDAEDRLASKLLQAVLKRCETDKLSGFHVLFPDRKHNRIWRDAGMFQRLGCQFHWFNKHYGSFAGFLDSLSSRKRKTINRERRKIVEQNIQIDLLFGTDITAEDWAGFYQLYALTYLKRSGHMGYLNQAFFQQIGQDLHAHTAMVKARRNGQWLAAALYFYDKDTLYGRYWGTTQEIDALHFECCYYQGIELAIQLKLSRFDAGAQGEHKIQRGFVPVLTQSWHHLTQPEFHRAIKQHVEQENRATRAYCESARELLPFKDRTPLPPADCLIT